MLCVKSSSVVASVVSKRVFSSPAVTALALHNPTYTQYATETGTWHKGCGVPTNKEVRMDRYFFGLAVIGAFWLWLIASLPPLIGGLAMLARSRQLHSWLPEVVQLVATFILKPVVTGAIYLVLYLLLYFDSAPLRALPTLAVLGPGVTALILWRFWGAARMLPRSALATLLALDLARWVSAFLGTVPVVPPLVAFAMPTLFMIVAWLLIATGSADSAVVASSAVRPPWAPAPDARSERWCGDSAIARSQIPRRRLWVVMAVAVAGTVLLLGPSLVFQTTRAVNALVTERQTPGEPLRSLANKAFTVVAWSPDGALLAATGNTTTVQVIAPAEDRVRFTVVADPALIDPVAWNHVTWRPQGDIIAVQLGMATQFIDARDGTVLRTVDFEPGRGNAHVVWSPDGRWLAVADRDHGYPVLLDPRDPHSDRSIIGMSQAVSSFAWSPDSQYLALGEDRDVVIADVASGSIVGHLATDVYYPVIAWSPDQTWIAVHGWYSEGIQLWHADTFQRESLPISHFTDVLSMAWHPDGKKLAVEQEDGTIQIWEPTGNAPVWSLPRSVDAEGPQVDLAWSSDGHWLAATDGANISLWDDRSQEQLTLPGHNDAIQTLAWISTQPWIVTGDRTGTFRLLQLEP
jgi:WD40 repeat protein